MDKRTLLPLLFFFVILSTAPLLFPQNKRKAQPAKSAPEWEKKEKEALAFFKSNPNYLKEHPEKAASYKDFLTRHPELAPARAATTAPVGTAATVNGGGSDLRAKNLAATEPRSGIPFETAAFKAKLSTHGASLEELTFADIKESTFKPFEPPGRKLDHFKPLHVYDPKARSFALTSSAAEQGLDQVDWRYTPLEGGGHRFDRVLPTGDLVLVKEFLPAKDPGAFHFELVVRIENRGAEPARLGYTLAGAAGMVEQNQVRSAGLEAVLARRDAQGAFSLVVTPATKVVEPGAAVPQLETSSATNTRIAFFGLRTKYFIAVVLPTGERRSVETAVAKPLLELAGRAATAEDAKHEEESPARQAVALGIVPPVMISPGEPVEHRYLVYVGPRSDEILDAGIYKQAGLDHLIDWGWPESVSRVLTWVLKSFHGITGNWGFAIILLTVLVRAILHPISYKGQKNMMRMQKVGPELQKLREKFEGKDGKMSPQAQREFSTATWELYRKHGVNPVGCLGPLFLQLPVFWALYNAVNHVYELRQAPFLGWIGDLSEPDVVARLPWAIFIGHGTNALCVLPILMIVTYVVQSKMTPPPADPKQAEQQKMMMWMMPALGYMFWTMPSGLLLYFVTSSIIGMGEQKWVKHRLAKLEAAWKGVPAKAN